MAEFHPLPPLREKAPPRPAANNTDDDGGGEEEEKIISTIPELLWRQYEEEAEQLAKTISRSSELTAQVPSLQHTKCRDFDNVYEPSDDTFLLLDAIQYDLFSPSSSPPSSPSTLSCVMEIGTGSGIPITFLVQNLEKRRISDVVVAESTEGSSSRKQNVRAIATDINPAALRLAQRTAQENGLVSIMDESVQTDIKVRSDDDDNDNDNNDSTTASKIRLEFVRCDFATPFLKDLEHQVDCLIFNPPYVPTPDSEVVDGAATNLGGDSDTNTTTTTTAVVVDESKLIEASWAGGERGRRVVDRFVFQQLPKLLSKNKKNVQDDNDNTINHNTSSSSSSSSGGVAYMVTVDDNEPYELACLLLSNFGLRMKPLVRRRARNEYLTIQKITWTTDDNEDNSDGISE